MRSSALGARKPVENPAYTDGTLPLRFRTQIDPDDVIVHVARPGEPRPWQRDGQTRAKINERTGQVIQPHRYTQARTKSEEQAWQWIMLRARRFSAPIPAGVSIGVSMYFRSRYGNPDGDNMEKLVLDSGNNILWDDDKQVHEHHIFILPYCTDPGTDLLAWVNRRKGAPKFKPAT